MSEQQNLNCNWLIAEASAWTTLRVQTPGGHSCRAVPTVLDAWAGLHSKCHRKAPPCFWKRERKRNYFETLEHSILNKACPCEKPVNWSFTRCVGYYYSLIDQQMGEYSTPVMSSLLHGRRETPKSSPLKLSRPNYGELKQTNKTEKHLWS